MVIPGTGLFIIEHFQLLKSIVINTDVSVASRIHNERRAEWEPEVKYSLEAC